MATRAASLFFKKGRGRQGGPGPQHRGDIEEAQRKHEQRSWLVKGARRVQAGSSPGSHEDADAEFLRGGKGVVARGAASRQARQGISSQYGRTRKGLEGFKMLVSANAQELGYCFDLCTESGLRIYLKENRRMDDDFGFERAPRSYNATNNPPGANSGDESGGSPQPTPTPLALRLKCNGCGATSLSLFEVDQEASSASTISNEQSGTKPEPDQKDNDETASKNVEDAKPKPKCRIGRYVQRPGRDKELVDDTEWDRPSDPARDRGYAIVLDEEVNYDFFRNETNRKELLTLVSPALVEAFQTVVKHFPGISLNSGKVTLTEPYAPLFFYHEELQKLADEDGNQELKDDLVWLTEFYCTRVKPAHDIIKQDQAHNTVIFDDLWALFRPGDLVYTLDDFGETAIHVLDATEYREGDQGLQDTYSIHRYPRFTADLWSITWDRATGLFQRIILTRSIKGYSDARPIAALPFYPLAHYPGDQDALCAMLQKRGRMWKKLVSEPASCKFYEGPAPRTLVT